MIAWRFHRHGNTCRLEIDLPWDLAERIADLPPDLVAEELVDAASPFLADFQEVIEEFRRQRDRRAEEIERIHEAARANRREYARIGRRANRLYRRKLGRAKRITPQKRERALAEIAKTLGVPRSLLGICLRLYRKQLTDRLAQVRLRKTVALLRAGYTNAEIATALGLTRGQVRALVRRAKAYITESSLQRVQAGPDGGGGP